MTCNNVLADKWRAYQRKCEQADQTGKDNEPVMLDAKDLPANFGNTFRGKILDDLGILRICCRRHMLGHVDMIDVI